MRFKKVLLVQSKYDSTFSNVLPAGIGSLSEYLSWRGIDNDVFDLNLKGTDLKQLEKKVKTCKPDLIGFSMMSLNHRFNYDIMHSLKETFPHISFVAGGPHISTVREEALIGCKDIDYAVVLEGEETLLELINSEKEVNDIKGLMHRSDKHGIIFNGERPFLKHLDDLPFPKYEKFDKTKYSNLISIFSSRGCPYECIYCPVGLAIGRRFIAKSAERVVEELKYHYSMGYRIFSFRDDNFTLAKDRVYEICDEIEKSNLRKIYLMCDNGIRADQVDRKLLERMRQVGFKMIGLGVEAGNDKILKILKKKETVKEIEETIRNACELGYLVELFFLIGTPQETWHDFEDSVNLATKYPVMAASFYHILPYPNTELFEIVKRNNYLLREPEEYLNDGSQRVNTPFFETPEFSYQDRKEAFIFANRKVSKHLKKVHRALYRKNMFERLMHIGLNKNIANGLATLYATTFIHDYVFNNKVTSNLKEKLRRYNLDRINKLKNVHEGAL